MTFVSITGYSTGKARPEKPKIAMAYNSTCLVLRRPGAILS